MDIESLLASAEREAEAASRAFGAAPAGDPQSASTAATLGGVASKTGPSRAGHHALALTAIEGADSDDDNELFDEFSCGDLYSFGQTEQTQSSEKPAGSIPTAAAAPSPQPPGPAASSDMPTSDSGKGGPAPVSRPLDAPSSVDRPSPSAPRLPEVVASAVDDTPMANEHSKLPAPCELHPRPAGIIDDNNNAAAAAMDKPVGACPEDHEEEAPADDALVDSSKELEREYASKDQNLEYPAGISDAPMAENLDGVGAEQEEQEQEEYEEVPAATNSTKSVSPLDHRNNSSIKGHREPDLQQQQQEEEEEDSRPNDWHRTAEAGGKDETSAGPPSVPPLQHVSDNAAGGVNHHEGQSRAPAGGAEAPASSEYGHDGAVHQRLRLQPASETPSHIPAVISSPLPKTASGRDELQILLSSSATEVDDGNAEPPQHDCSSPPSHHNLSVHQARVEPGEPVPQRSPHHPQQQAPPPPPPSWGSEALPGQGGLCKEVRHQAKTGEKTPSSPPPSSTSARGRHPTAHHSSRPPLIPQHQAARPPPPKRPRSPEYQNLQEHQPHHRNSKQLPPTIPDETMPPPAAPAVALPRSTGPDTGICSDAPPPHAPNASNAPSAFATAADAPVPRGSALPQPCSQRNPPPQSPPPAEPRLMGPGSGSRTSAATMPLPLTVRSQQKPMAASLPPVARQLSSPCDDAALLSLGALRKDASPLGRGDGTSIPTVAEKAMKLTRKIDQMLLECQDQHDRCLETCVKLAITRNLQSRLFSPVVLGELMEVEERARKAGLLTGREETTD